MPSVKITVGGDEPLLYIKLGHKMGFCSLLYYVIPAFAGMTHKKTKSQFVAMLSID